ncbi:MAG: hypothetical protein SFV52_01485 [Saprospiraceae bacterium]|nr:hypothetical protein [Saprospiraceae bacterium]
MKRIFPILALLLLATTAQRGQAQCSVFIDPPGGTLTCEILEIPITAFANNATDPVYNWTGPGGFNSPDVTIVVTVPGVYTISLTDQANGCTATNQVIIVEDIVAPLVDAGPDITFDCSSPQPVILSPVSPLGQYDYQWTGPGGFSSNQFSITIDPAWGGPYYELVVTDQNNGCTASDRVNIGFSLTVDTDVQDACASDGAISVLVNGGTPPYQYLWSNGTTTQEVTNLSAGIYCVTVTDVLGCTVSNCDVVLDLQPALVSSLLTNPAQDLQNGSIILTGVPANTPYSFEWNTGDTSATLVNLDSGTYIVTITNLNSGCTQERTYQLLRQYPSFYLSSSLNCNGTTIFQVTGGTPPFTLTWSGPVSGAQPFPASPLTVDLPPGLYTMTIQDGLGQAYTQLVTIDPNPDPCAKINGFVRWDENTDCLTDATELGIGALVVQAFNTTDTFYALTNANGFYQVAVAPGDYTVRLIANSPQIQVCTNDLPASIPTQGDSAVVNFSIQITSGFCPLLAVDILTPLLRRCFISQYKVQYVNQGFERAVDAYVDVTLDPWLAFQGASVPHQDLGNNRYRFSIGDVEPFQGGFFSILVLVSCNAVLGQTHCTEAHIYPDTLCTPVDPAWSGALLDVRADCDNDSLRFEIRNTGTGDMSAPLQYIVIEDQVMLQGQAAPLAAGASMFVSVPANGSTWRLEVTQEPLAPVSPSPSAVVEGCAQTGQAFSTGFVNQLPIGNGDPWLDVDCTRNIGAYDPNDKQGFPTGYGPDGYIRPGTEMRYLIRFQNTGTDTAFNVVIRDTLADWFDSQTARPGPASHPYTFEIEPGNILVFDFENILLPDSNVNLDASNGYVEYRIKPKADAPLETDLLNRAAIYFDFNDPVITNTTRHRLGENFIRVGAWQPAMPRYAVRVFPNPATEQAILELLGASPDNRLRLHVYRSDGTLLFMREESRNTFALPCETWHPGVYYFRIEMQNGQLLGNGSFVKK